MTVAEDYEIAVKLLTEKIAKLLPEVETDLQPIGVPVCSKYDERDRTGKVDIDSVMLGLDARSLGFLWIVPVVHFSEGSILSSAVLRGTLAKNFHDRWLEVLTLRDRQWLAVSRTRLPSGKFPTQDFISVLQQIFSEALTLAL